MKGSRRLKMSQMSIIFKSNSDEFTLLDTNYIFTLTYDVLGRLFETLMNMVVNSLTGKMFAPIATIHLPSHQCWKNIYVPIPMRDLILAIHVKLLSKLKVICINILDPNHMN